MEQLTEKTSGGQQANVMFENTALPDIIELRGVGQKYGSTTVIEDLNLPFKDFEVVIVDGYHAERQDQIRALASELQLDVKHLPLPSLNYMTELTHSTNRNEALKHAAGEVVIFFDDYQQPAPNFVEAHVRMCHPQVMVAVQQDSYYYHPDVDYSVWGDLPIGLFEHVDYRNPNKESIVKNMDPRSLWTNSSSVHISDLRTVLGV